jgi:hypothetical protein
MCSHTTAEWPAATTSTHWRQRLQRLQQKATPLAFKRAGLRWPTSMKRPAVGVWRVTGSSGTLTYTHPVPSDDPGHPKCTAVELNAGITDKQCV